MLTRTALRGSLLRRRFGGKDAVEGVSAAGADGGRGSWAAAEDGMSGTTPVLDEAFEQMAAVSFELRNGCLLERPC
ncbi:MAG TPA: hypothetical protein VF070_18455 [Streptosporangiaceae bacterium]